MNLKSKILNIAEQIEDIQTLRTGEITRLKNLKRKLKQLKQKQTLIKMKNQKEIARQILDQENMKTLQIKVSDDHRAHLEKAACALDLTPGEAASFLLFCYLNDVRLAARLEKQKITN